MDLVQVYGDRGVPYVVEADTTALVAVVRQHRDRLLDEFRALTDDEWASETRCTEWSARDLACHLVAATEFFNETLDRGRRGEATRLLEGFDPQASPAEQVASVGDKTNVEVLAELEAVDADLRRILDEYELDPRGSDTWLVTAEAPPGHVPARHSLLHLFFDSWLHERDLLVPLGREPRIDPGEVGFVVSYLLGLAALASLLSLDPFPTESESVVIELEDAPVRCVATLGLPTVVRTTVIGGSDGDRPPDLRASGAQLAEAMSGRDDLATLADTESRLHAVLAGALPFLSAPATDA